MLVTIDAIVNINIDNLSINVVDPNDLMDATSIEPFVDDRFVSNTTFKSERQMVTCSLKNIFKPNHKDALTALHAFLNEPCNLNEALEHRCWIEAMHLELEALENNNTWGLAPRTSDINVL